ncbi:MAG: sensor histidine kinase, partial [Nitrospira sp.]|nr:sensor histidine kinase [Nitrospira sp.]
GLMQAYELGRRALMEGVGVLDMLALQQEVRKKILLRSPIQRWNVRTLKSVESFFLEGLPPFEMAHRGFREANAALRHLHEVLEKEAKRIAHELHDEAGQLLASVHIALDQIAQDSPTSTRERLLEVRGLLNQIEEQLRRLSHELRPTILDDMGLIPALEFLIQGVSARTGIQVTVEGSTGEELSGLIQTTLYRIVQAALNNVSKHSKATRVNIWFQQKDREIHCSIQDDGVGFNLSEVLAKKGQQGIGLIGIRERLDALGGTLKIMSTPGKGTGLHITIPIGT